MLDRFNAYTLEYRDELANLSEDSFEKFKAGVLTSLTEPPKNLQRRLAPLLLTGRSRIMILILAQS